MTETGNLIEKNNQELGFNVPDGWTRKMTKEKKDIIDDYAGDHDRFVEKTREAYDRMNSLDGENQLVATYFMYGRALEVMGVVKREALAKENKEMVDKVDNLIERMENLHSYNPFLFQQGLDINRLPGTLKPKIEDNWKDFKDFIHFTLKGSEIASTGSKDDDVEEDTEVEGV